MFITSVGTAEQESNPAQPSKSHQSPAQMHWYLFKMRSKRGWIYSCIKHNYSDYIICTSAQRVSKCPTLFFRMGLSSHPWVSQDTATFQHSNGGYLCPVQLLCLYVLQGVFCTAVLKGLTHLCGFRVCCFFKLKAQICISAHPLCCGCTLPKAHDPCSV